LPSVPRVLFINGNTQDYLADGVFHGLRSLLGPDAVDFPRADYLYDTFPSDALAAFWGRGFTLYGLLPDIPISRHHVLWRAIEGEFDVVIFGDIWRSFGIWSEWGPRLRAAGQSLVVLDGHDTPRPYPFSFFWWRRYYWWCLPRAHTRAVYFKRERTPATRWFSSYLLLPPPLGRTLGTRPISFAIPEEKIVAGPPVKDRDFPTHIVDAELAIRLGEATGHAFTRESDYYADLRRARFGITTKRRGWDAMRHYEIAASGAVPCFRDLDRKPSGCAPFGLTPANSISYRNADDLMEKVRALSDAGYDELQRGALAWAHANSTTARARALLAACGIDL
jgi:hypothetical protein